MSARHYFLFTDSVLEQEGVKGSEGGEEEVIQVVVEAVCN